MRRARDFQRSRVYKAERATWEDFEEPEFRTVAQCREFVTEVTESDYWRARTPQWRWTVNISDGRGRRNAYAYCDSNTIALPLWSRSRRVILHELAHLLAPDPKFAAHGPEYASAYLDLAIQFLGESEAEALKESFANHKVRLG